jgi:hypothetical protein
VERKGDLSNTVVTGENAVIDIAQGAKVKELDIKAPATVHVEKGAVVDQVKKDPAVKGDVKVDNEGTVNKSDSGIDFGNSKTPKETTQPTPGGSGGPVSGETTAFPNVNIVITGLDDEGTSLVNENIFTFQGIEDSFKLLDLIEWYSRK